MVYDLIVCRSLTYAQRTAAALERAGVRIATHIARCAGIPDAPFAQDDPVHKPQSLKADLALVPETLAAALEGRQIQPVLLQRPLSPP